MYVFGFINNGGSTPPEPSTSTKCVLVGDTYYDLNGIYEFDNELNKYKAIHPSGSYSYIEKVGNQWIVTDGETNFLFYGVEDASDVYGTFTSEGDGYSVYVYEFSADTPGLTVSGAGEESVNGHYSYGIIDDNSVGTWYFSDINNMNLRRNKTSESPTYYLGYGPNTNPPYYNGNAAPQYTPAEADWTAIIGSEPVPTVVMD